MPIEGSQKHQPPWDREVLSLKTLTIISYPRLRFYSPRNLTDKKKKQKGERHKAQTKHIMDTQLSQNQIKGDHEPFLVFSKENKP